MTKILVTSWYWQLPYYERDIKETEKYKPDRYIIGTDNIFEGVHIT